MTTLTDQQAITYAYDAGFRGSQIDIAVAVASAESGLNTAATNTKGNTPPSTDRGLYMFNSFYHPEVSDTCAFDPACASKAAYALSAQGTDWSLWSTWKAGAYKPFLIPVHKIRMAMGAPYAGGAKQPPPPGAFHLELDPWPFYNQMADPAMDGDVGSGPNAPNDCGPESTSMNLAYLTNVILPADTIWDMMQYYRGQAGRPTGPGYTDWIDQQTFWKQAVQCDTALTQVDVSQQFGQAAPNQLLAAIKAALTAGHPLVGLFSFSHANAPDGHFRSIYGMSQNNVIMADPATGKRWAQSYQSFWSWSKGSTLEIKRKRAIAQ